MNKKLTFTAVVLAGLMFEAAKQAIKDTQSIKDYSDQAVKSVSAK